MNHSRHSPARVLGEVPPVRESSSRRGSSSDSSPTSESRGETGLLVRYGHARRRNEPGASPGRKSHTRHELVFCDSHRSSFSGLASSHSPRRHRGDGSRRPILEAICVEKALQRMQHCGAFRVRKNSSPRAEPRYLAGFQRHPPSLRGLGKWLRVFLDMNDEL